MRTGARRFGFVLLPGYSLLGCSAAVEVLAAANEVLGEARYESTLLSLDGRPVLAGCGSRVAVQASLQDGLALAAALVASESLPPLDGPDAFADPRGAVASWLRLQALGGAVLGGLGCGAAWLARAGLLAGYRATVHHARVGEMGERHPETVFSRNVYEIDRDRISCGPGTASLDLLIAWLARTHGESIVAPLLAHFGLERLRASDERQRVPATGLVTNAKVTEAVALMEANLQEPLPTDEIARLVGVSRRQLERLFKQHLDDMPSRYYIEMRLVRARHLLRHSGQSILQIGLACGFASASRFSSCYRARFGHTPRDERSPRAAEWKAQREPPPPPGDRREDPA